MRKKNTKLTSAPAVEVQRVVRMPLPIGTKVKRGTISGITFTGGERYYFVDCPGGVVALMPACVIEHPND
jgi:hypothetical protein